ncbi:hypothetical protein D9757_001422 [Collybiopsis confluens]|uniref:Nucleolar protein 12 n=1 Tax=Collybiopsis confluens TaxID=2823264 RepID=A0A8H5HZC8_9AGAR|nr:hypothetical protein D9757_001422 [Collybiopsis confluens]
MALSSFLQASSGKVTQVDSELDSLFKASASSKPRPARTEKLKRKHDEIVSVPLEKNSKIKPMKKAKPTDSRKPGSNGNTKTSLKSGSDEDAESGSEEEDDDPELENAYLSRTLKRKDKGKAPEYNEEDIGPDSEGEEEIEGDSSSNEESIPQHESITKMQHSKKISKPKSKYIPPEETLEQRNARTIFVGNLSVEVAQKKSILKSLHRHIFSLIENSDTKPRVESTRFRSVPFAIPTSNLENDDVKESTTKGKSKPSMKSRQHEIDRTSSWKKSSSEKDEIATKGEKQFLTPAQKKKIAFINQEIHASGSSVNAYIVFAHPGPASGDAPLHRPNLPPLPEVMNPYIAARLAKENCDGSEFMERTLRVDVVAHNADVSAAEGQGRVLRTGSDVDPKRCVFVGNLDFESKEEDVRAFFEGVISAEKGPRIAREGVPEDDSEASQDESDDRAENEKSAEGPAKKGWVTRVRIIRDKDTQLGKGFAYVQFAERDCVDEILAIALEPGKLKFAKRKLRVERCKTIPGAAAKSSKSKTLFSSGRRSRTSNASNLTMVPKGDPNLGVKLAHLSKEQRKSVKAGDADRTARRLAKKKARMTMAIGKDGQGAGGGVKIQGKDRARERKPRNGGASSERKGKGHGIGSAAKNKGKAISTRAMERRNTKK